MDSLGAADDFRRKVDTNISRLVESYRLLLKCSVVEKSLSPHTHLQLSTASANIVLHGHSLLDQINELRLQVVNDAQS